MGFGDFDSICKQSALPVCSILGAPTTLTIQQQPAILAKCVARSIELANTIIFAAATDFAHIAALIMTTIMILHVRSKFTAVGRKEILTFFYTYLLLSGVSLILDAGVIEATQNSAFPYFVAIQNDLTSALCTSLLINGFVGFQLYEDGTNLSIWLLRSSCVGMFVISFMVSLLTFKGWAGLGPESTTGLFVVLYVINALFIAVYAVMQFILVVNTLQDRWPLGDLIFGVFFLVVGQVLLYALGATVCENTSHYLDSLFFATVCNLLAVMMVYKYWDSITQEDLEFSVGAKQGSWETKEMYYDDPNSMSKRASFYDLSYAGNRSSTMYDNSSLDYNPRPASSHHYLGNNTSNQRLPGHGYAQLAEGRQSYGDVRKSAQVYGRPVSTGPQGLYDEFEGQQSRERSKARKAGHGRVTSNEVVFDRD